MLNQDKYSTINMGHTNFPPTIIRQKSAVKSIYQTSGIARAKSSVKVSSLQVNGWKKSAIQVACETLVWRAKAPHNMQVDKSFN